MNTKTTKIKKVTATVVAVLVLGAGGYAAAQMVKSTRVDVPVAGAKKENAITKQASFVWFPATTGGNQENCADNGINQTLYPQATYPTVSSLPQSPSSSEGCEGFDYCCAKGYNRAEANFVLANIGGQNYWVPASATPDQEERRD